MPTKRGADASPASARRSSRSRASTRRSSSPPDERTDESIPQKRARKSVQWGSPPADVSKRPTSAGEDDVINVREFQSPSVASHAVDDSPPADSAKPDNPTPSPPNPSFPTAEDQKPILDVLRSFLPAGWILKTSGKVVPEGNTLIVKFDEAGLHLGLIDAGAHRLLALSATAFDQELVRIAERDGWRVDFISTPAHVPDRHILILAKALYYFANPDDADLDLVSGPIVTQLWRRVFAILLHNRPTSSRSLAPDGGNKPPCAPRIGAFSPDAYSKISMSSHSSLAVAQQAREQAARAIAELDLLIGVFGGLIPRVSDDFWRAFDAFDRQLRENLKEVAGIPALMSFKKHASSQMGRLAALKNVMDGFVEERVEIERGWEAIKDRWLEEMKEMERVARRESEAWGEGVKVLEAEGIELGREECGGEDGEGE